MNSFTKTLNLSLIGMMIMFFTTNITFSQCPSTLIQGTDCVVVDAGYTPSTIVIGGVTYNELGNSQKFFSTSNNGSCPGTNANGTLSINGNTCFYVNGVLPVSFLSLKSKVSNGQVTLTFSTTSETNNDYFTVERSSDATHFDELATMDGAGNSNTEIQYDYTDVSPLSGTNYYRVKQTDFDGKYSYSDIISVQHQSAEGASKATFISNERLHINTSLSDYTVLIFNTAGQIMQTSQALSGDQDIRADNLANGMYFVKLVSGGSSQTFSALKY
jgi:hypothetical protein